MESDYYPSDFQEITSPKDNRSIQIQHIAILAMLVFVMASFLVPVWQSAVNRSLEVEYKELSTSVQLLEEQHRLLRSQIAEKTMPESLLQEAWKEDIFFQQIEADHLVMVARGN
ncbi:MAG: hypothetical protein WCR13_03040 [Sphaerochaeta sp.]